MGDRRLVRRGELAGDMRGKVPLFEGKRPELVNNSTMSSSSSSSSSLTSDLLIAPRVILGEERALSNLRDLGLRRGLVWGLIGGSSGKLSFSLSSSKTDSCLVGRNVGVWSICSWMGGSVPWIFRGNAGFGLFHWDSCSPPTPTRGLWYGIHVPLMGVT